MSFTFTLSKIDNLLDPGEYIATIRHADSQEGKFGETFVVEWEIELPDPYIGHILDEKFNIGSDKPEFKKKAEKKLSIFFNQVLNLQPEQTIEDVSCLINKRCKLTVDKWTNDAGRTYQTVLKREPYSDYQFPPETAMKAPESISYGKVDIPIGNGELNDDVPFL